MDSRQADSKSDMYSLGCTLHFLLTGRPPYGGDTIMKRLTAHQQAAIPAFSASRPMCQLASKMCVQPDGGQTPGCSLPNDVRSGRRPGFVPESARGG